MRGIPFSSVVEGTPRHSVHKGQRKDLRVAIIDLVSIALPELRGNSKQPELDLDSTTCQIASVVTTHRRNPVDEDRRTHGIRLKRCLRSANRHQHFDRRLRWIAFGVDGNRHFLRLTHLSVAAVFKSRKGRKFDFVLPTKLAEVVFLREATEQLVFKGVDEFAAKR